MERKGFRIGIDARLWNETGVGRYIRNLVTELQKIDTENAYVLFVKSQDLHNVQRSIFNDQWRLVPADIQWHTVAEQRRFPKMIEKEHLDLMHFPYFSLPIWYTGKFVLTIHDLILHHFPTGKASTKSWLTYKLKHQGYKYIIAQAVKKAAKIIAVSEATKKEIVEHLHVSDKKVVVTYEGVDAKITNSKLQNLNKVAKYEIQDTKYFLYVGNAYPHKNLETLIEAFSNLKSQIVNSKLILVGKEDYFYKRLEKKVEEMGLSESIVFKHTVSDEELAAYYTNALALVVPSLMEGFGLPLLEAMSHECLVVASDIPVFHEIAEDIPVYFSSRDVMSLTNVLESIAAGRIHDAKERKTKGKVQAKKFTWEKMAKETLAVYKSCLGI